MKYILPFLFFIISDVFGKDFITDFWYGQDGDYIIVKRVETAYHGDTVVALVNNEATLKRYYIGDNGVELHPQNPKFDILHIKNTDTFQINGIVLAVIRNYF